jgi:hypothetical protein
LLLLLHTGIRRQPLRRGLNAVQIASDPAHPCGWRPYLPTISYRVPGHVLYVRIEDRVGNVSAWYRLKI